MTPSDGNQKTPAPVAARDAYYLELLEPLPTVDHPVRRPRNAETAQRAASRPDTEVFGEDLF